MSNTIETSMGGCLIFFFYFTLMEQGILGTRVCSLLVMLICVINCSLFRGVVVCLPIFSLDFAILPE